LREARWSALVDTPMARVIIRDAWRRVGRLPDMAPHQRGPAQGYEGNASAWRVACDRAPPHWLRRSRGPVVPRRRPNIRRARRSRFPARPRMGLFLKRRRAEPSAA